MSLRPDPSYCTNVGTNIGHDLFKLPLLRHDLFKLYQGTKHSTPRLRTSQKAPSLPLEPGVAVVAGREAAALPRPRSFRRGTEGEGLAPTDPFKDLRWVSIR